MFNYPLIIVAKIFAVIIHLAQEFPVQGVLTAIFATYAVFGIVNSLLALMNRDKL